MLRLVAAHRSSLLEATRRHVAQALHASGDLRAAENYYIQAGKTDSSVSRFCMRHNLKQKTHDYIFKIFFILIHFANAEKLF